MINYRSLFSVIIIGLLFFIGCEKDSTLESHEDYSVTELLNISEDKFTKEAKAQIILRWKDTVDNGDDPMNSGCHMEYATQNGTCPDGQGVYFGGDSCSSARKLIEYTNSSCHKRDPIDTKVYDCHRLCVSKGYWFGRCKNDFNACGNGNPSAYCKCFRRRPQT